MRQFFVVLTWSLIAIYPALVYFGLRTLPAEWLGGFILGLALIRYLLTRSSHSSSAIPTLMSILLALAGLHALLGSSDRGLMFYPAAVNASLLLVFSMSLVQKQTVIERIARLTEPDLPETGVAYARKVNVVWCFFFLINGAAALYTALYTSRETWVLYNGFIAYLLMGLLFSIEWLVRRKIRQSTNE